jgi:transcriptional regulator with XRE-family HTH domain
MPGVKRPNARITGAARATEAAIALGHAVRVSRKRRRMMQKTLAARVGISQARLADVEAGRAAGAPLEVWFSLAEALGRPFRAEFLRDGLEEPLDAGHLGTQELVLRLGRAAGYEGRFELATRPDDPSRSTDVVLVHRRRRRMILIECWNSFGNIGAAARSSDRKVAEARAAAIAFGGDAGPFGVSACWVVRDTRRNRELLARYPHLFEARLPGSSAGWVAALTKGDPPPAEPGFVWSDAKATRLLARRTRLDAGRRGQRPGASSPASPPSRAPASSTY